YQATAYLTGPSAHIKALETPFPWTKSRKVMHRDDTSIVVTETGNNGETLSEQAIALASQVKDIEALIILSNEAGFARTVALRNGEVIFQDTFSFLEEVEDLPLHLLTPEERWVKDKQTELAKLTERFVQREQAVNDSVKVPVPEQSDLQKECTPQEGQRI